MKLMIKSKHEQVIGGIVYQIGVEDSDHDVITDPQVLWNAQKSWMKCGHPLYFQHENRQVDLDLIESFQADVPTTKQGQTIPAGAWYIAVHVGDKNIWKACLDGRISGLSMAGRAVEEPIEKSSKSKTGKKRHRLVKMTVDEISLVDEPANRQPFMFMKRVSDDDDFNTISAEDSEEYRRQARLVAAELGQTLTGDDLDVAITETLDQMDSDDERLDQQAKEIAEREQAIREERGY